MRGPMRVRRGFQGGRESAGDGIDNPYRVEGRLGAEPQVAAASQRQPGARIDKPYRLGADGGRGHAGTRANRWRAKAMSNSFVPVSVEGVVGRVWTDECRGRCRTRSHRWGSRACGNACEPMACKGVVGRVRSDGRRGRCRTHSHRAGPSPANRQPTDPSPPWGEARRTCGVSHMVEA